MIRWGGVDFTSARTVQVRRKMLIIDRTVHQNQSRPGHADNTLSESESGKKERAAHMEQTEQDQRGEAVIMGDINAKLLKWDIKCNPMGN